MGRSWCLLELPVDGRPRSAVKIVVGAPKKRVWDDKKPWSSPLTPHPDDDWRFNPDVPRPPDQPAPKNRKKK